MHSKVRSIRSAIARENPLAPLIVIRTVTFRDGEAVFHAGGGVTLLSDPQEEYEETLVKAERVFAAFRPEADTGGGPP